MKNNKNNIFSFQVIKSREVHFPSFVKEYLDEYIQYLKAFKCSDEVVTKVEQFAKNINICLSEYYYGQHSSAQYFFRQALNCIQIEELYCKVSNDTFYRARKSDKGRLRLDEMFHIPFQERYKVKTQRYSYPGLPCLYLGASIAVCCEEIGCRDENLNIARIKKKSSEEIKVFDLFFFENYDFRHMQEDEEKRFICVWPLVACCSFVYEDASDMSFRPDYIIPQLLLEYIVDKNAENGILGSDSTFYGVRYHSVKNSFNSDCLDSSFINYVFPVFSNKKCGFCDILEKNFYVEDVFLLSEKNNYSGI